MRCTVVCGSNTRVAANDFADKEAIVVSESNPTFTNAVQPLFRERDRKAMKFAFDLGSYEDVKQNAEGILQRLEDGSMPCDGAWSPEQIDVFRRWVAGGMPE